MLLSPLFWLFPSATRLGWITAGVSNPPATQTRAAAYLFRGTGAIFTSGFGPLCDQLRAAGVWTEDLWCVGDAWACRHLAEERAGGRLGGPLALVGHSRGGRRALVAAARFERMGIDVDLVVCVDVAFPPLVPANVRRAIHVFRSGRRLYPARPLQPGPNACTRIDNIDLDQHGAPFPGKGLHHLNITGSPALQAWIAERIGELAPCRT
jgi:pimeloyl-ACP methyl ester carboxylesterase